MNKLARAVTKCTKAWDKRVARLISYIHHTSEFRQYCYVNAEQDYFKILILHETGKTKNQQQVDSCVLWEVKHLYQKVVQEANVSFTQFNGV